jgi:4-amino-4-deoxy-L-arabinose transferase-like glycosyltransferase
MTTTSAQHGAAQPAGRSRSGRARRLLRARPDDPAWARPALLGLLVGTGLLYLVGLSRNGWANEFYAAAVQAGTKSWRAFLFGSLDSSNFITVDKPAGFLWPMDLAARIFGLNSWSLLVPQALEGVATVGVLYATVRRWFGPSAALIAGAVAALTPVATLMFRFDNPDALLVLLLTLAAYATTRAIESGRTRWLALAGAFLGLGFLAKMLAAFTVLPGFALAYLWAGPPKLGKRIWQLLIGGAAVVAAAGWWVAIDLLTPAADRPYVSGSSDNNILNLTFGYNGFGRLTGNEGGAFGGAIGRELGRELGRKLPDAGQAFRGFGGGMFGGATGITRLFQADMGGQVTWLIPAALIALAAMLWMSRRAPRTDRTRAAAMVWGGWLLVTGLVFSYMSGIIHPYYTIALAPAIGALVGIGSVELWRIRHTWFACAVLAVGLVITVAWAWVLLDRSPGWYPWLRVVIVIAGVAAAVMILAGRALRGVTAWSRTVLAAAPVPLVLIAALGAPLAYSIDTAATTHTGPIPSAGPTVAGSFGLPGGRAPNRAFPGAQSGFRGGAPGGAPVGGGGFGGQAAISAALSKLLETGASGYRWAAATVGSTSAASMELGSNGVPVMAIGGFSGSDPAPSLAEFEELVSSHEIHYFVSGGGPGGFGGFGGASGRPGASGPSGSALGADDHAAVTFAGPGGPAGGSSDGSQITSWVEAHFESETVGGTTVYDLSTPLKAAAGSSPARTTPGAPARPSSPRAGRTPSGSRSGLPHPSGSARAFPPA